MLHAVAKWVAGAAVLACLMFMVGTAKDVWCHPAHVPGDRLVARDHPLCRDGPLASAAILAACACAVWLSWTVARRLLW